MQVARRVSRFNVQGRLSRLFCATYVEQVLAWRLYSTYVPGEGFGGFNRCVLGRFRFLVASVVRWRVFVDVFLLMLERRPGIVVNVKRRVNRYGLFLLERICDRFRVVHQALIKRRPARVLLRGELSPRRRIEGRHLVDDVVSRVFIAERRVVRGNDPTAPVSRSGSQVIFRELINRRFPMSLFLR